MTKAVWGAGVRLAGLPTLILLILASVSCGQLTRQGTASSYLIITSLQGSSGASPGSFGGTLDSDVLTVVDGVPTIFSDQGQVQFVLGMKDPGPSGTAVSPSQANWITVERYHVAYIRSDGRNTQGVDVPYAFDGAFTATVSANTSVGFTLVRHQAKEEAPLAALANNGAVLISTIGQVTFYGHDQTGREVSVTGQITISFGNYGDPK